MVDCAYSELPSWSVYADLFASLCLDRGRHFLLGQLDQTSTVLYNNWLQHAVESSEDCLLALT